MDVITNILVLNVAGIIEDSNVIFVPKVIFVPPNETTTCPHLPVSPLPTPIRYDRLAVFLDGYPIEKLNYLISGFKFGFSLHFEGLKHSFEANNLSSCSDHPDAVDKKLAKELDAQRLAGPFATPPFPNFRISPLGVVPKKTPGEFRLIHHLSFPKGTSVNDGISSQNTTVSYATITDAIQLIKQAGRGCYLAKTDIRNAFRLIPIRPDDYDLLGIKWKGVYYYDRCMPMGCSSSCRTFEAFSTAVEWIAKRKLLIDWILHLLDDFLLVASSQQLCLKQLELFLKVCDYLGIPMAPDKTVGPSTTLSFAGIELDTIVMEARLPLDKLEKTTNLLSDFLRRKKVTLKEVQSLCGLLNFACAVVSPGRAFLRRLIDLTIGVHAPHHFIRLNKEVKADLNIWQNFLAEFNGKCFFLDDNWNTSPQLNLYTDAAGSLGFGAIFGNHWCYGAWPSSWLSYNIAVLEFYPIVLSLYLWGHHMQNQSILFFTDNEALVSVINKQTCRDKTLMFFVRKMVLICLKRNILFKAKHIPGVKNKLADALSRLQVHTFLQLVSPPTDPQPTVIPQHLLPQNWQM
jgi:hypothetical protein